MNAREQYEAMKSHCDGLRDVICVLEEEFRDAENNLSALAYQIEAEALGEPEKDPITDSVEDLLADSTPYDEAPDVSPAGEYVEDSWPGPFQNVREEPAHAAA